MRKFIFTPSLLLFFGHAARACATCGLGSNDASNGYFLKMILFMTVIPLILAGSAIYYLWKNAGSNDPDGE